MIQSTTSLIQDNEVMANKLTQISLSLRIQSPDAGIGRPLPEIIFSSEVEQEPKRAPQNREAHVRHDSRDVSSCFGPGGDKLAKAIAPQILVNCNCDENRADGRLVAVNCVGTRNCGERSDLNTGTSIPNNDDDLITALGHHE